MDEILAKEGEFVGAAATTFPEGRVSLGTTVAGLCVLLAHGPLLTAHLVHLWNRPHYQFVGLLLPLAGWLMWQRWPRRQPYVKARRLERGLLCGSVGILTAGVWLNSPYLAAVSAILAAGFLILHQVGAVAIGSLLPVWLLLWFAVPPPLGYDLIVVSSMQSLTSRLASLLLDLLCVDHLMAGNVLRIRECSLFVDEACSGVHSLFALLAYTAVFVVLVSRGMLRSMTLMVGSVGWALLANVLRVSMIAATRVWWGMDLSTGWSHEALGFVTFVIALCLTLSTDRWLHFIGHVIGQCFRTTRETLAGSPGAWPLTSVAAAELHQSRLHETKRSRIPRPSAAMGLVAISAYSLLFVADVSGLSPSDCRTWKENPLDAVTVELMPQSSGAMELLAFERVDREFSSDFGRRSCVWTYAGAEVGAARIAMDGSFSGWHELTRCYAGQGWRVEDRRISNDGHVSWVEAKLSKPTGEHACLIFTLVSLSGRPLDPSVGQGTARLIDRMRDEQTIQVQAFVECGGEVDEVLHGEVSRLFQTALSLSNSCRASARSFEQSGRESDG